MADKEIEINGKKYGEDTQITLKAKTLIWVIGLLITGISTLATVGYFDIKNDVKQQKENFQEEKTIYMDEIKVMMDGSLKESRDKRENMIETIGEIKGDIKMILDRTSRNNDHNNNEITSPINNTLNIPTMDSIPSNSRNNTNGTDVPFYGVNLNF